MSEEVLYSMSEEKVQHAIKLLFVARRPYVEYLTGDPLAMANDAVATMHKHVDMAIKSLVAANESLAEWIEDLEESKLWE